MAAPTVSQVAADTIHGVRSYFRFTSPTGVAQVIRATAVGTISTSGNLTATLTAAGVTGSPIALAVAVLNGDTPAMWAQKVRLALAAHVDIAAVYSVDAALDATITLRRLVPAANDGTLNLALANGTSVGATAAPTSTVVTAGSASGAPIDMISKLVDYEGENETIRNMAPGADGVLRPNRESQKSSVESFVFDLAEIKTAASVLSTLNKVRKGTVEIWIYDPDDAAGKAKIKTAAFACSVKREGNIGFGAEDFASTKIRFLNLSGADVVFTYDGNA